MEREYDNMKLTEAYNEKLSKIQELYQEAFPAAERKPFEIILEKRQEGAVEILALETEDGEFRGLAISVLYKDMVLLDYFAVSPKQRGHGTGSAALRLLKQRYADKRFFLEIERTGVEAENALQRSRRKEFYLRNGMTVTPLLVELFGTEMEILTASCQISYEEYYELYVEVFGKSRMGRKIKLIASE